MSTFNELINKVEKSNHELVKIRDTIETESIDLGSSIIDAMRELYVADQLTSPTSTSIDDLEGIEQGREDKKLRQDQITVLNKISDTIDKIYAFMLDGAPDDKNPLDDLVPPVVPVPLGRGGKPPRGGAPGVLGQMRGFFSKVFKRLLKGGIVALIANEVLNFFGLTTDDVFEFVAEKIRNFEFPDLSEITLTDVGEKLDSFVNNAADFIFGEEGTLESGLEKAATGAAIGTMIAGPFGGLVGAAIGFIAGYFTSDDAKGLYERTKTHFKQMVDDVISWFKGVFSFITGEKDLSTELEVGALENEFEEAQKTQVDAAADGTAFGTYAEDTANTPILDTLGARNSTEYAFLRSRKDLEKEIEELNQAGMKLEELKAKQLEVMADRENLTMLEFKEKYGVSIGGQRRFANKISDDLQVARQELEQEQEDVMTQRQIEQAATIRYQDTSSSDNSTNIQYIQASKYELSPKR